MRLFPFARFGSAGVWIWLDVFLVFLAIFNSFGPVPTTPAHTDTHTDYPSDGNSNHGSYFHNQLASLQILVGDNEGAKSTLQSYFTGIYQQQISANGDQVYFILPDVPECVTKVYAWCSQKKANARIHIITGGTIFAL